MRTIRLKTCKVIGMALAGLLLAILLTGSAWAMTFAECGTCHGADIVEGHHDPTPGSDYEQGLCEKCHVGITTGNDCSVCHTTSGYDNKHHIPPTGQTTVACANCHVSSSDPTAPPPNQKDCRSCHHGDAPPAPIRTYHHTKLPNFISNGKLMCGLCHPGAQLTNDCQGCHPHADRSLTQQAHHDYAAANDKPCTLCHTGMTPLTGSCKDCHKTSDLNGDALTLPQDHHKFGAPCVQCHSANLIDQSTTGCAQCHSSTGSNRAFHHETVNQDGSLTCAGCHTGTPADYTCASCHSKPTST